MARALAICSFVLLLACAAFAQVEQQSSQEPAQNGSKGVADALREFIPEDIETVPLAVTYENEASGEILLKINAKNSGVSVPLADAVESPAVKLTGSPNDFYTLVMVDVDAPNGQGATDNINYLHWMVANIPGQLQEGDVVDTVVEYAPPTPPAGTHRYMILAYVQDGFVAEPVPVTDRANFDYTAYADSNALMGPVSAIYYAAAAGQ